MKQEWGGGDPGQDREEGRKEGEKFESMNILKPCRAASAPFTNIKLSLQIDRRNVRVFARTPKSSFSKTSSLLNVGIAQFLLPGIALAEDIASDVQNGDLTNALPDTLPAAEEVRIKLEINTTPEAIIMS